MFETIRGMLCCVLAYLVSRINKKYKNCYLVAERGVDARDNGYWFYKYLKENYPNLNVIYIIAKDSPDFFKINRMGDFIEPGTIEHGVAYYGAAYLIGSHPGCGRPNWKTLQFFEKKKLLVPRGRKIFLQHGITKDLIPSLMSPNLKVDMFVCGARPEYEYIKDNYGFAPSTIVYTGFARFDSLYQKMKLQFNTKMILVMPTWRHFLNGISEQEFIESDYYRHYNELLTDQALCRFLEESGWKLIFYPHYEVQKWVGSFKTGSTNVIIADFANYDVQTLLIQTDILVTDYSSVFFDCAYMKKKIIFYQFDYEQYRQGHYAEGYFDYENSFGPVVRELDELKEDIRYYTTNPQEEKYVSKIDEFFELQDEDNCKRIFEAMIHIAIQ